MSIIRIDDAGRFEGVPLNDAQTDIQGHGYEVRLMWIDGRTLVPDYEPSYDPLRINLRVQNGNVTRAWIG